MKKILLLLTIILFSCNKDEVRPHQEPKQVEKYEVHLRIVPVYSNDICYIYSDFVFDNLLIQKTIGSYNGYDVNYTFTDSEITTFNVYVTSGGFNMEEYTLIKYYDNGTSEIVEEKENISYNHTFFYGVYHVDSNGNNVEYKYFTRNLEW